MLEVNRVSAGYGEYPVLRDISFRAAKGESLSVIGLNGSGKTTLLRTIAHLIPFEGEVLLDGYSSKKMKRKQLAEKVALFSQITSLYFDYSIYDTVMMGRYAKRKRRMFSEVAPEDEEAVVAVLKATGLWDIRKQSIMALSGGQLQRALLAKTLVQDPEIILLDEPTNHLDLYYQIELIDFLKKWATENQKTVIGVLHDINLAVRLSERILLIHDGKIEADGPVQQVLQSDILRRVYRMDVGNYMREALKIWDKLS